MKLFIRLTVISGLVFLLFSSTDQITAVIYANNIFVESTTSLLAVASIVGFILFIIFTYFVEFSELRHLVNYHKSISLWMNISYTFISLSALIITITYFDFRRAIVIAIIYLTITILYDYVRERIMLTKDMSRSHPKTII